MVAVGIVAGGQNAMQRVIRSSVAVRIFLVVKIIQIYVETNLVLFSYLEPEKDRYNFRKGY